MSCGPMSGQLLPPVRVGRFLFMDALSPNTRVPTRYPLCEVGGSNGYPPYQLAGLALSLHRPGRVTTPRAATAQIRAKNIRQPRSRTAPFTPIIMCALSPFFVTHY